MGYGAEVLKQYALSHLQEQESSKSVDEDPTQATDIPVFPGISLTEQLIFDIVAKAPDVLPTHGLNEQIAQTRGEPYSLSTISNAVSAFNQRGTGYKIENTAGRGKGVKAVWAVMRVNETEKSSKNTAPHQQKKEKDWLPEPFITREAYVGSSEKAAVRIGDSQFLPNGDEIFPARVGKVIYEARRSKGNNRKIPMIHYKPLHELQIE